MLDILGSFILQTHPIAKSQADVSTSSQRHRQRANNFIQLHLISSKKWIIIQFPSISCFLCVLFLVGWLSYRQLSCDDPSFFRSKNPTNPTEPTEPTEPFFFFPTSPRSPGGTSSLESTGFRHSVISAVTAAKAERPRRAPNGLASEGLAK